MTAHAGLAGSRQGRARSGGPTAPSGAGGGGWDAGGWDVGSWDQLPSSTGAPAPVAPTQVLSPYNHQGSTQPRINTSCLILSMPRTTGRHERWLVAQESYPTVSPRREPASITSSAAPAQEGPLLVPSTSIPKPPNEPKPLTPARAGAHLRSTSIH